MRLAAETRSSKEWQRWCSGETRFASVFFSQARRAIPLSQLCVVLHQYCIETGVPPPEICLPEMSPVTRPVFLVPDFLTIVEARGWNTSACGARCAKRGIKTILWFLCCECERENFDRIDSVNTSICHHHAQQSSDLEYTCIRKALASRRSNSFMTSE